jgi:hypothetical protein
MADDTLFLKIVRGEIQADVVYRDDLVTAFRDIHPQAPVHVLIVPNHVIPTAADVTEADEAALGRLFTAARTVAEQEGSPTTATGSSSTARRTAARRSTTSTSTCSAASRSARCARERAGARRERPIARPAAAPRREPFSARGTDLPPTMRRTSQRRAILQALDEAAGPLTPHQVLERAGAIHGSLGLATVYRNLARSRRPARSSPCTSRTSRAATSAPGGAITTTSAATQCEGVFELSTNCPVAVLEGVTLPAATRSAATRSRCTGSAHAAGTPDVARLGPPAAPRSRGS